MSDLDKLVLNEILERTARAATLAENMSDSVNDMLTHAELNATLTFKGEVQGDEAIQLMKNIVGSQELIVEALAIANKWIRALKNVH